MLIFLCWLLPIIIPIAIGSVLLGALGLFGGSTPALLAAALAVLF